MADSVRWITPRDFPDVLRIERRSFDDPWTEGDFRRALRGRGAIGLIVCREDRVLALAVYRLALTQLHVLNFAVDPDYRRQGVGRLLLESLATKAAIQHKQTVECAVRETNLAMQLFLQKFGFLATRILPDYYGGDGAESTPEDAYAFSYEPIGVICAGEAGKMLEKKCD